MTLQVISGVVCEHLGASYFLILMTETPSMALCKAVHSRGQQSDTRASGVLVWIQNPGEKRKELDSSPGPELSWVQFLFNPVSWKKPSIMVPCPRISELCDLELSA
jgi:hypothetical protein